MAIGNILSFVTSTPWAMSEESLLSLVNVLDVKLNDPTAYKALVALTQNTKFSEQESSAWETDHFKSASGNIYDYIKVTGTLVPRTGSMRPYCGMVPTIQLANIIKSSDADTLILHLDSGGGAITGISETANLIHSLVQSGKEIIAFTDTVMASAAYWIGSACSSVVVSPSALVGSIGVYSVLHKADNNKSVVVKAGSKKAYGHPNLALTDEEVSHIQNGVNEAYTLFTSEVAMFRGASIDDIKGTEAEVYTGRNAPAFLVDHVMTLDELLTKAKES
jgi:ClpP class serine protease